MTPTDLKTLLDDEQVALLTGSEMYRRFEKVAWDEKAEPLVAPAGKGPCIRADRGCKRQATRHRLGNRIVPGFCRPCERAEAKERAERERQERIAEMLRRAGATERMSDWTLDTYPRDEDGKAAREKGERWLETFADGIATVPNLLLYGPVGSGKTGLAWALLRRIIEEYEIESRYVLFPELLDRMKESFGRSGNAEDVMEGAATVPLLALDDVGAERITEWTLGELFLLIDRRYQRKLPTIYTLNYSPDEFIQAITDLRFDRVTAQRIVSRIAQGAVGHRFFATDRRKKRR